MEKRELRDLLKDVSSGSISVEQAEAAFAKEAFSDLGFAKVDHQRGIRQGVSEVIYGAGKTAGQITEIVVNMLAAGQERILITRLDAKKAQQVSQLISDGISYGEDEAEEDLIPEFPLFTYYDGPNLAIVGEPPEPDGLGTVIVAAAGTSDLSVAEEAALTAEMLGNKVARLYDVGVAGLHRLLAHGDDLASAKVIIAVAGMEGALPSVIGGLVSCPVIAVPTSVGYGASFQGVAALLAMLNSCASGISVVNIDNGFGAGYQASLINHIA